MTSVGNNGGGASTAAAEQRHAIAVAVAKAAEAEAAVATAQAALQDARLTKPSYGRKHHFAAIVIQTAFRGYLVRKKFCLENCCFCMRKNGGLVLMLWW